MNNAITAGTIVNQALAARGAEFIKSVATFGWPKDEALEGDTFELRCAVQDEAKRVESWMW